MHLLPLFNTPVSAWLGLTNAILEKCQEMGGYRRFSEKTQKKPGLAVTAVNKAVSTGTIHPLSAVYTVYAVLGTLCFPYIACLADVYAGVHTIHPLSAVYTVYAVLATLCFPCIACLADFLCVIWKKHMFLFYIMMYRLHPVRSQPTCCCVSACRSIYRMMMLLQCHGIYIEEEDFMQDAFYLSLWSTKPVQEQVNTGLE